MTAELPEIEDLRSLIREAHEMMKDLRTEKRELRALLDRSSRQVEDALADLKPILDAAVQLWIEQTGPQVAGAREAIIARFDKLADDLMQGFDEKNESLEILAEQLLEKQERERAHPLFSKQSGVDMGPGPKRRD